MYYLQHKKTKKFLKKFTEVRGLYLTTEKVVKARKFNHIGLNDFFIYYPFADDWDMYIPI